MRTILQCVLVLVLLVTTASASSNTTWHEPRLVVGLEEPGAVAGRVVDLGGKPIANARVRLSGSKANERVPEVVSNARGEYELSALPAGERTLEVVADGYQVSTRPGVVVRAGAVTRDVNLTLSTRLTISGVVVSEREGPIADARVAGYPQGAGRSVLARTDALGRFTVSLEVAAPHRFVVDADGYEREPGAPRGDGSTARTAGGEAPSVELGPYFAPGATDVRVALKRPRVTFVVIDALSSQPLPEFTLRLDERFIAGAQQSFSVAHYRSQLHPGGELECKADSRRHSYVVTAPGYSTARGEIVFDPPDSRRCVVRMTAGRRVRGVVTLEGQPVAGAQVILRETTLAEFGHSSADEDADAYWFDGYGIYYPFWIDETERKLRSDSGGAFEFDSLSDGDHRLEILTERGDRLSVEPIVVREGLPVELGALELRRAGSVRGRLITQAGESAEGIRVDVSVFDVTRHATADAEGRFTLQEVPAGRAHLSVDWRTLRGAGLDVPTTHFDLAPGQEYELEVDLSEDGAGTVRVDVLLDGRPAAGVIVSLQPTDLFRSAKRLGATDTNGVVRGRARAIGMHDVCITAPSGMPLATLRSAVQIYPNSDERVQVDLKCGRLTFEWPPSPPGTRRERVELRGRRLDREGALEPLFYRPSSPAADEVVAHADNRCEFPWVEPGEYEWTIRVFAETPSRADVERIYRKQTSVRAGVLAECSVDEADRVLLPARR